MASRPDYSLGAKRVLEVRYASEFASMTTLHVGGSGSGGINEAIADLVAAGIGGKVIVSQPATIRQRIKMWWDNIEIEGTNGALLTKCNEIVTLLTANGVLGNNYVDVTSVAGLQVGDTVIIVDDSVGGSDLYAVSGGVWNDTKAEITSIDGLRVYLSNNLRKNYTTANNAALRTYFSIIESGYDEPIPGRTGLGLKNIYIDGNIANQSYGLCLNLHAAIDSQTWYNALLENIKIISWQDMGIKLNGQRSILRNYFSTQTKGMALHMTGLMDSIIDGVEVNNSLAATISDIYQCAGVIDCALSHIKSIDSPGRGFWMTSDASSYRNTYSDCDVIRSTMMGWQIFTSRSDFLRCKAIDCGKSEATWKTGFLVSGSGAYRNKLINCRTERTIGDAINYGFVVYDAAKDNEFGFCDAFGHSYCGIEIYSDADRTKVLGGMYRNNGSRGIEVRTSDDVHIDCVDAQKIVGETQLYGVVILDAACDRTTVHGCNLRGNSTNPLLDGGTNTNDWDNQKV